MREDDPSPDRMEMKMFTVTIHLLSDKLTIPCTTRHAAEMVIGEWQRLGFDGEVSIDVTTT